MNTQARTISERLGVLADKAATDRDWDRGAEVDRLREILAEAYSPAPEPVARDGWVPIEEAPPAQPDPDYVLVSNCEAGYVFVGYRHEPNYPDDPEWCDEHGEFIEPQPTHFQRRPDPPRMVAVCCGRRECGGECGNEWCGMEYRPLDPSPPQAHTGKVVWEYRHKSLPDCDHGATVTDYEPLIAALRDQSRVGGDQDDGSYCIISRQAADQAAELISSMEAVPPQAIATAMVGEAIPAAMHGTWLNRFVAAVHFADAKFRGSGSRDWTVDYLIPKLIEYGITINDAHAAERYNVPRHLPDASRASSETGDEGYGYRLQFPGSGTVYCGGHPTHSELARAATGEFEIEYNPAPAPQGRVVATVGRHWGDGVGFDLNDFAAPRPAYGTKLYSAPANATQCATCENTGMANVIDPEDGALVLDDCPECGGESRCPSPIVRSEGEKG